MSTTEASGRERVDRWKHREVDGALTSVRLLGAEIVGAIVRPVLGRSDALLHVGKKLLTPLWPILLAAPPAQATNSVTVNAIGFTFELELARWQDRVTLNQFREVGTYEQPTTLLLSRILGPGQTFVDVGASIGYFSMLASRLVGDDGKVYAFEPFPESLARLKRHLEMNRVANVIVLPVAAWDRSGSFCFYFSEGRDGTNSLVWGGHRKATIVPAMRLDDVVAVGKSPIIIKIDVEGGEPNVLRGASKLISSGAVRYIIIEWSRWLYESFGDLRRRFELYQSIGDVYTIEGGGFVRHVRNHHEIPSLCNLLVKSRVTKPFDNGALAGIRAHMKAPKLLL